MRYAWYLSEASRKACAAVVDATRYEHENDQWLPPESPPREGGKYDDRRIYV